MPLGVAVIGASRAGRAHAAACRAAPTLSRSARGFGQARASLEEVPGIDEADSLPPCGSFDEGVLNTEVLAAVAESATRDAGAVRVSPQREPVAMSEAGAR